MQAELNEKQKILNSKNSEFEKMLEISSKSEEKLKLSNEYNNYIEKNTTRINDETAAIYQEKLKIEDDLQDLGKKIEEKQIFISEIKKKIKSIKSSLENENMKNKTLTTNIESAKANLKGTIEKNEEEITAYEQEKNKIKLDLFSPKNKKFVIENETIKRRGTIGDQNYVLDPSKEEVIYWQKKYNSLEIELSQAKDEIEKLKKNEIYLNTQLKTKDLMIHQINSLVKQTEKSILQNSPKNSKLKSLNPKIYLEDLATCVNDLQNKYKNSENLIKCNVCSKIPNECFLAVPCGHLSCLNCKQNFESFCPVCFFQTPRMIHSINLNRIFYNFQKESETIEQAKKILNLSYSDSKII